MVRGIMAAFSDSIMCSWRDRQRTVIGSRQTRRVSLQCIWLILSWSPGNRVVVFVLGNNTHNNNMFVIASPSLSVLPSGPSTKPRQVESLLVIQNKGIYAPNQVREAISISQCCALSVSIQMSDSGPDIDCTIQYMNQPASQRAKQPFL